MISTWHKYHSFLVLLSHAVWDGPSSRGQDWVRMSLVESWGLQRRQSVLCSLQQLLMWSWSCPSRNKCKAGDSVYRGLTISVTLLTRGIGCRWPCRSGRPRRTKTRRANGGNIFHAAPSPVRDAVERAERKKLIAFIVDLRIRGRYRAAVRHGVRIVLFSSICFRALIFVPGDICQRTSLVHSWPCPPWLEDKNVLSVVKIHPAFVEVYSCVPTTGTLTAVYKVEASQTGRAVLAVQFSYSPLGLDKESRCTESHRYSKKVDFNVLTCIDRHVWGCRTECTN